MTAVDRNNFTFPGAGTRIQGIRINRVFLTTGAATKSYYYRAYDTGTAGYVIWGPYNDSTSGLSPLASVTTPNYTGTLQNQHIYLIK